MSNVTSNEKPECVLIGTDGNAFSLIGKVEMTLKRSGMRDKAAEFETQAFDCPSYDALLNLIRQYVTVR